LLTALYHPPRPQYQTESLLDYIEASINELNSLHPAAFIALAGDFNQLTDNVITERTGLVQIVHQPTRRHNKLDRIFVSNLAYSTVHAMTSVVKSDHLAVIACSNSTKSTITNTKSQHKYRPKTATQHARFLDHISTADISFVPPDTVSGSVQTAFDWFCQVLLEHMNSFYPERVITTTSCDTAFTIGTCESLFFVRIESQIESPVRFVFESNLRIESAVYTTQAVTQPDGLQAYRTGL